MNITLDSCQDFFSPSLLPPLRSAKETALKWFDFDNLANYTRAGGHPIYGPDDIDYRLNRHGFRGPELTTRGVITVAALGCSFVFGLGVREEEVYHYHIANRLRDTFNVNVVVHNLGINGGSMDTLARLVPMVLRNLKPDLVLINFPHRDRREHVSVFGKTMKLLPGTVFDLDAKLGEELFKHYQGLASEPDDLANMFRNYSAIKYQLRGTAWMSTFLEAHTYELLQAHVDEQSCCGSFPVFVDTARDHGHPGPQTHLLYAKQIWGGMLLQGKIATLREALK